MGKDAGCEGLLETEEKIKWSGGGSCVIPKNDCRGKRNMINMSMSNAVIIIFISLKFRMLQIRKQRNKMQCLFVFLVIYF